MATLDAVKPANYDIQYYNNDEFDMALIITDENGDAVDLSAKTITFTVKEKKTSTANTIEISTDSELSIGGASNNVITFSGNYDLSNECYVYDLYNNTDEETIMYGKFIVISEVHD